MRIKHFLGILLFGLLAACGTAPAKGVDNAAATKIVATFMAQITQTAAAITPAAPAATETDAPAATETPIVSPTSDSMIQLLGRFRTVTVSQGNLFVRDGTGVPVQITKSGKDHDPVISSDGKKIVFYRGEGFSEVFAINADGSEEKTLINNKLLPELGVGEAKFLTFWAGTHNLFFTGTVICGGNFCVVGNFIAEADSGKIIEFARGVDVSEISPNGQYFFSIIKIHGPSVQIDLYRLNENIVVHSNLMPSVTSFSTVHWLSDSSGFIAFEDDNISVIWRYNLKDYRAEKITLEPALPLTSQSSCGRSTSPDDDWILYADNREEVYLANLQNIQSQPYEWDGSCDVKWAPDSQHFASQTAIGSVDGTPPITLDGRFTAWVDATHYLFTKGKGILDLQTYIAEVGKESAAVPTNFIWSPTYAVMEP